MDCDRVQVWCCIWLGLLGLCSDVMAWEVLSPGPFTGKARSEVALWLWRAVEVGSQCVCACMCVSRLLYLLTPDIGDLGPATGRDL